MKISTLTSPIPCYSNTPRTPAQKNSAKELYSPFPLLNFFYKTNNKET